MLKLEKTEVVGWEAAIRGMRNPMNSWDQSDSHYESEALEYHDLSGDPTKVYLVDKYVLGSNDLDLIMKLRAAGIDHRKFMRMIEVYVDITAPLYWWKEFDTYKVGTVANSCSTMHKIAAKEFKFGDFSCEHLERRASLTLKKIIDDLNYYREYYISLAKQDVPGSVKRAKDIWWQMIQLLPSSYNQRRTVMLNYEVLANIYKSRRHHKLDEWHTLCDWIEGLPYSEMITGGADYLNKKLTIPDSDEIIADTLRKLQSSDSPDKSKAILMELYEQLKKVKTSTPPKDFKIVDEWNQHGHVDYLTLIGKRNGKTIFGHQEKGDTSDAKPE